LFLKSQKAQPFWRNARSFSRLHAKKDSVYFHAPFLLPSHLAGAAQLRRSMIWQHLDDPSKIKPMMPQPSAGCEIVPELAPNENEVVIDKITMSAFEGTFLNIALRDARLESFVIAGICARDRHRAHRQAKPGSELYPDRRDRCLWLKDAGVEGPYLSYPEGNRRGNGVHHSRVLSAMQR
jgi:hypothetical protein